jgi:[amino group carrier protein]-lysine/ornithine hydrolase
MDPVSLLENLLNLYSPSGQEAEAVNYLVERLHSAGFSAWVDEAGNAVGTYGDGPETIMLLGHIDTVPGFISVRREGDQLWGRGAVDAKGPLACFVAAAARARASLGGRRLVVIGAVGEEADSPGAHYVKQHYQPALTFIGEPSGWEKITLGYKGSAWYTYRVQRQQAHSAAHAESACEAAVNYWNRLNAWARAYNTPHTRVFEQASPSLRRMESQSDGFSDTARLHFNVRLPQSLDVTACTEALQGLLDNAELTLGDGAPAYRSEKNSPLVRALLAAIRQAGGTPSFSLKSGTSDMNVVGPAWNTPIVAYGPGDSALDHTPNEYILISEYLKAIDVLSAALSHLAT